MNEDEYTEKIRKLEEENAAYLAIIVSLVSTIRLLIHGSNSLLLKYRNLYVKTKAAYDKGVLLYYETSGYESVIQKASAEILELISRFKKK